MRIRHRSHDETKVEIQMTPMIDVVFQLLVFFLFTFRIRPVEGEIAVTMPPAEAGAAREAQEVLPPERLLIRLRAGADGRLADILLEEKAVGTDLGALHRLLTAMFPAEAREKAELEIDADGHLRYGYVVQVATVLMRAGFEKIQFREGPSPEVD
jgi:biopolymer transport protein ExbD